MSIVSNTSPILNLALIGRLDLIQHLYERIQIPEAVYRELQGNETHYEPVLPDPIPTWIRVCHASERSRVNRLLQELDAGEAEAIILALERNAELLLMDELRGRSVARRLGIPIVGTIGVLIEAKRKSLVSLISPILGELQETAGFWISDSLYALALELADE